MEPVLSALQKDEALTLPDQISNIIRGRISSGEYAAGKRLGSIRQFANDFDVSPVTVIKALDILEEEALIRRIPMKGVYVSEELRLEKRRLNVCFAFPEKEISPGLLTMENWALSSELQRGLLAAAPEQKAILQFVYFEDVPSPELLQRQVAELKNYDMAIFVGRQLLSLQQEIAGKIPAFRMIGDFNEAAPPFIIPVNYDREDAIRQMVRHIRDCSCHTAGVIGMTNISGQDGKIMLFRKYCKENRIEVSGDFLWNVTDDVDGTLALKQLLRKKRPDFFYCIHADLLPRIYEAAFQSGLTVGKDFQIAGLATGLTFSGLLPRFTYFQIPRFEMGYRIMSAGIEAIRSGRPLTELSSFHVKLIQGNSTNPLQKEE